MNFDQHIAKVPAFPKPGITFYDISPILEDPAVARQAVNTLSELAARYQPDVIIGLDARGFLFSLPVALALDIGTIMVRKAGKLPGQVIERSYALEYGEATLAIQTERDLHGKRVVIIDDLLATGGTVSAAQALIEQVGATVVASLFVVELTGLNGRARLSGDVHALQQYEF
ncbi:adenine phosphoribosyltransferase [Litorivicinus lipolyticus]|uniref:Adenine phosphoribosyltransferase n=1 Tax=Litorivicinus lipolyticus TaxID=418701 RepID=A0A5Q2Q5W2_9GAMM|nr:adenine phosphoribosyltransferase [Litorivicinus lipolyticus]QGG79479.1 adenine phosphoribosyltransferase [Litorivicinus lipolyticus]